MLPEKIKEIALNNPWLLVILNILGTGFGYWYYRFQLMDSPLHFWPLIPVSPNATLFMALSLGLYALGKKNRWTRVIDVLAFIGNLKYGLWTVVVMLSTPSAYLNQSTTTMFIFLVVTHALMATQALIVLDYTDFDLDALFSGALWYTINDVVDYFGPKLHTPLPEGASFALAGLTATALTFTSIWAYLYSDSELFKKVRRMNKDSEV
ncbi:MAG: putative membrane protein YpjA [Candidatus Nanohaloarchaea archaeon]|jgi:uncharacterized membrane protein YpjA